MRDDIVGQHGAVWTRTAKNRESWRDDIVGQHGAVWTRTAKNRESWRDDIVGQHGAVWTRTAKDRERWRTLAEDYFLQWKDTAWNRIYYNDNNDRNRNSCSFLHPLIVVR